jgi:hypothetical protein
MPVEIDEIQRKILQAEIEREALKKESDPASQERLAKLEDSLEAMRSQIAGMKTHWEDEKRLIQNIRTDQGGPGAAGYRGAAGRAGGQPGPGGRTALWPQQRTEGPAGKGQ